MRRKFIRYGVMMLPDDPLHADPVNAIDGNMLADALDLINVPDTWDASLALTSIQGKRKRMIENNEADQDEYMVATVILSQEIKVQRQRRRIAKLESALLQLRESTVLASRKCLPKIRKDEHASAPAPGAAAPAPGRPGVRFTSIPTSSPWRCRPLTNES